MEEFKKVTISFTKDQLEKLDEIMSKEQGYTRSSLVREAVDYYEYYGMSMWTARLEPCFAVCRPVCDLLRKDEKVPVKTVRAVLGGCRDLWAKDGSEFALLIKEKLKIIWIWSQEKMNNAKELIGARLIALKIDIWLLPT